MKVNLSAKFVILSVLIPLSLSVLAMDPPITNMFPSSDELKTCKLSHGENMLVCNKCRYPIVINSLELVSTAADVDIAIKNNCIYETSFNSTTHISVSATHNCTPIYADNFFGYHSPFIFKAATLLIQKSISSSQEEYVVDMPIISEKDVGKKLCTVKLTFTLQSSPLKLIEQNDAAEIKPKENIVQRIMNPEQTPNDIRAHLFTFLPLIDQVRFSMINTAGNDTYKSFEDYPSAEELVNECYMKDNDEVFWPKRERQYRLSMSPVEDCSKALTNVSPKFSVKLDTYCQRIISVEDASGNNYPFKPTCIWSFFNDMPSGQQDKLKKVVELPKSSTLPSLAKAYRITIPATVPEEESEHIADINVDIFLMPSVTNFSNYEKK